MVRGPISGDGAQSPAYYLAAAGLTPAWPRALGGEMDPQHAVVTLLAVCNSTHRESYLDIVMVSIVGGLLALAVVIMLGTTVGYF